MCIIYLYCTYKTNVHCHCSQYASKFIAISASLNQELHAARSNLCQNSSDSINVNVNYKKISMLYAQHNDANHLACILMNPFYDSTTMDHFSFILLLPDTRTTHPSVITIGKLSSGPNETTAIHYTACFMQYINAVATFFCIIYLFPSSCSAPSLIHANNDTKSNGKINFCTH